MPATFEPDEHDGNSNVIYAEYATVYHWDDAGSFSAELERPVMDAERTLFSIAGGSARTRLRPVPPIVEFSLPDHLAVPGAVPAYGRRGEWR